MVKFSYGIYFYKENIYSLDDPEEFKIRVTEAEETDTYFSQIMPNMDFVRPYILLSYRMNKNIKDKDRINYIIGLIYANNYIDMNDVEQLPEQFEAYDSYYGLETSIFKTSIWNESGFRKDTNDLKNNLHILSRNEISKKISEYIENHQDVKFTGLIKDSGLNKSNDTTTSVYDEDDEEEEKELEEEIYNDELFEISIEAKIDIYKNHAKKYIKDCIKSGIKNKTIHEEDTKMVKAGMKAWFKYIFSIMDDLVEIRNNSLDLKNENICDFL